ncbi:hypothetical protein RSWS8N_06010 [Cereibacter sphaeroides WS8N]|nr:hypothetical protein RSWS8N_06010 [Cereibacter sphaeroides WS8N]EKX55856.1 hypothetical protein D516_3558 [Rhodobacter sp. AKP1]
MAAGRRLGPEAVPRRCGFLSGARTAIRAAAFLDSKSAFR